MTEGPLVLLIEDDSQVRRFLRATLGAHGYRLLEAETGDSGLRHASTAQPDVILLDLGLPDIDGLEVTRRLRDWTSTPTIVISARGQEADKVNALDAGADDYLTKPFGTGELLARVRVALRHAQAKDKEPAGATFSTADVTVDLNKRQVHRGGAEVHLTPLEYKLLATMIRHADKVVTHRQLLKEVWGPDAIEQTEYLRVFMGQLRHKLESAPARPRFLLTEPGVGYRLLTIDVS